MSKKLLLGFAVLSFMTANALPSQAAPSAGYSAMKVSERPQGESKLWTKSSWGYQVYLEEYALDMVSNGSVVETIEDSEGNVWFNNPTIGLITPNWYKGEKDGNSIVVKGPQEIAVDPDFGRTLYIMPCEFYEDEIMTWYRPTADREFRYNIVDGKIESADKEIVLGLCFKDGEDSYRWAGYGDYDIVMTAHTAVPLSLPEGVEVETWTLYDGEMGHHVTVGFSGDEVYVGGVLESLPDGYIKGEVSGSEVRFASNQYLGIDEKNLCDAYFIGAIDNSFLNDSGEYVVWFDMKDDIIFEYDAEAGKMTCGDEAILVNAGTEYTNKLFSSNHPSISKLEREAGAAPVAPEFTDIMWYEPDFGFGAFAYIVPNIDVNGYPLATDRLYYELFYNDDLVTFYPDECPGLEEPMDRIPYDYYDDMVIFGDETGLRTIIYYSDGVDSISLQSVYVEEDGTEVRSAMATVSKESVYVEKVSESVPVSVEYFDLQGRKVSDSSKGLVIVKTMYEDGTVKTSKSVR